jgi:hypothetical protein
LPGADNDSIYAEVNKMGLLLYYALADKIGDYGQRIASKIIYGLQEIKRKIYCRRAPSLDNGVADKEIKKLREREKKMQLLVRQALK